jgi:simple sugar transport system permease protein
MNFNLFVPGIAVAAAPLALAGCGALWTELAGFLAIAIEGWMELGAFLSYCFTLLTGSVAAGAAISALITAAVGALLARFVITSGSNPFITGLAFNLCAAGAIPLISGAIFGTSGVLRPPSPIGGASTGTTFIYIALIFALASAYLLRKTPLGLRLIATGISENAAATRGIHGERYKILSWTAAAFLAALGGAALTARLGVYAPSGVAGRGWLAIAAAYLGFRKTRGVLIAALVFAAADRLAIAAQAYPAIPATALLGLPQAIALVLYSICEAVAKAKRRV